MTHAILFDMDGILVDTEPLMCEAVIGALEKQGVRLSEKQFYDHWTRDGKNIMDFVKDNGVHVNRGKYRSDKKEMYHRLLKSSLMTIAGVPEKIREFSKIYKLALVSSSDRGSIILILEMVGLKEYFPVIVSCDDVGREKPAPDGFLLAAKLLGVKPEECVVIEDAEKGIIAAKSAGMKAIAIPNQHTLSNDFSDADHVANTISELSRDLVESL